MRTICPELSALETHTAKPDKRLSRPLRNLFHFHSSNATLEQMSQGGVHMLAKSAAATAPSGGDAHPDRRSPSPQGPSNPRATLSSRVIKDPRPGLTVERYFTRQGVDPFDTVEWELRDAVISGADGKVFFEQRGVEF